MAGNRLVSDAARFGAEWCALAALWVSFVGSTRPDELLVGAVAVSLASAGSEMARRHGLAPWRVRTTWLLQFGGLPALVVAGTGEILRILGRHLLTAHKAGSHVRSIAFDGSGPEAELEARKALAVALTTTSPNFIVIDFDQRDGEAGTQRFDMVFHQLEPSDIPKLTRRLGAIG